MIATSLALAVGLAFGAIVQRTHFCTMGAIADVALFGSLRRLKSWLLALAVALAMTQAAIAAGWLNLGGTPYAWSRTAWLPGLAGGLVFGFGMVLAGGCLSRNLARLGAGSLKALVTLLLAAVTAASTLAILALPSIASIIAAVSVDVLPDVPPAARGFGGLVLAAALVIFGLADPKLRHSPRELWGGIGIGLLVPAGWLAYVAGTDVSAAGGLTFAVPLAATLASITHAPLAIPGFAAALVLGAVAGAFVAAWLAGQLRLETFAGPSDMARHLVGGLFMGIGGGLAGGCTVGHGITGLAALAPISAVAMLGIVAGCLWALRWLETGRLLPFRARAEGGQESTAPTR
jgi:uncharacterized membrane protein YedE/YeeE